MLSGGRQRRDRKGRPGRPTLRFNLAARFLLAVRFLVFGGGMNDRKFAQAGNIYLRAVQFLPEQREQFLANECADDECRAMVESMFDAEANSIGRRGDPAADLHSDSGVFEQTFVQPAEMIRQAIDQSTANAPVTLGRYRITGTLGQGTFGRVYLARDDQLDRDVAVKLPRSSMKKNEFVSFLQEARRVAQLRHPGIVAVFDVGKYDDRVFIVSDFISGSTLTKWSQQANYSWQRAAAIVADIADALGHAHSQGIVHRDVKPSNIMMTPDGKPVLLDFGLAVSASGGGERPGVVAGTPHYMSPEQTIGKAHRVDGRTDLYALGVVFYEMLSGQLPFAARSAHELLRRIAKERPKPLGDLVEQLHPDIEAICLKAMSPEIANRPSTMADFATELRRIVAANPESDSSLPSPSKTAALDSAPHPSTPCNRRSFSEESNGSAVGRADSRIHDSGRRQVTALFCDIDEGEADLDPEELYRLVAAVQEVAIRVAQEFGAHIGQQSVEGLLLYFGYPTSFEDAVFRAVRAGREILELAGPSLDRAKSSEGSQPSLRIGIHTGLVVTEEARESDQTVSGTVTIVGNVSRIATTLAIHSSADRLVISETVHRITGSRFDCQSIGAHKIKGLRREIDLFEVVDERGEGAAIRNRSPMVGREHELGLLSECWRQTSLGNSQVVLVCAEAGVGKSRLFEAFEESVSAEQMTHLSGRASAYHINSALWPVSQLIKQLPGLEPAEPSRQLMGLETLVDRFDLKREDSVPFLADLTGLTLDSKYPPFEGTPERRKQRTLAAVVDVIFGLADEQPTLVVVEDLHWIDASTLDLISQLIGELASSQLMLVLTYRPRFTPPWRIRAGVSQFTLGHLHGEETRRLVEHVAGIRISAEVVSHISKRTDGVPLFVEEMTKAVLESGVLQERQGELVPAGPLDTLPIPETLHDSLMARLDRMGQAKDIAQIASVIGRDFSYRLLCEVAPFDESTLQRELKQLVEAELIFQRGRFPRATFLFKHALVQDTACESLLRRHRQKWHGKIAEALLEKFADVAAAEPEVIARHFDEAKQTEQAVEWWTKAALLAQEQSAHDAAINHFQRALILTEQIEREDTKLAAEFRIQAPLGVSVLSTQGYAAPQVGPIFERARELSERFGGPTERFFTLWGIWAWRVVKDELDFCCELGDAAFDMKDAMADPGLQMEAHFIRANTYFNMGHFEEGVESSLAGVALYDEERCRDLSRYTGQNSGVTLWCYVAMNQLFLGHPRQAVESAEKALEIARQIQHVYSKIFALHHLAWIEQYWRRGDRVVKLTSEEETLSEEFGFLFWQAESRLCRGYGHLLNGDLDLAETDVQDGMTRLTATGSPLALYQFHTTLAEISLRRGDPDEALTRIDEALRFSATCLNHFMLAETHRIRGEILLAHPDQDRAAAHEEFTTALQIARGQQATQLELRAAISLTRLSLIDPACESPIECLRSAHDWFPESLDLPDLIDARQLLAEF
jgi:serine/threonine protein kinase/tetratricopeptide (TPR) repeat protein